MKGTSLHKPLAIVGMACLLPGADGLDAFWQLLEQGRDAIVEMPPDRLDRSLYYDERKGQRGKTYSTLGGLVPERSPQSGDESYDVCHRLLADIARAACQHAGLDLSSLPELRTGVFVGHSGGSSRPGELALATLAEQILQPLREAPEFELLARERQEAILREVVSRLREGRPGRTSDGGPWLEARWGAELVARELGLNGPNLVVDAACASSLVAVALGAMALESGEIDLAIVGGASYAKADSLVLFSHAQSCSASGTRPFDDGADGLIGSEGYVALVLKTMERARRDQDKILAVIRGIGLSTDGRGKHLWAPRKEGQLAAVRRAYGPDLGPGQIQYVEAHATSTQVGDATELESLSEFYGQHLQGRKLPIGSVKSNLGHTLETAGLAALLKVVLALQHEVIPPTCNVKNLNSSIDWNALPFEVALQAQPWSKPDWGIRRAALSAFGIGGLNVHMVVEEPGGDLPAPTPSDSEPIAIVGRGVVLPGAYNVDAFKTLLKSRRPALSEASETRWPGGGAPRGGFITDYEYDYLTHRVPPKQVAQANPLQFMLLDATEQALKEAGTVDRERAAVVVGTQFGGEFGNQLLAGLRLPEIDLVFEQVLAAQGLEPATRAQLRESYREAFLRQFPALMDETGSFTSSTLASRITKTFHLEGGAMALEAGECSSLVALATGAALLRGGVCSAVVCAGAMRSLDLPAYEALQLKGYFEGGHFLPGEGVGVLVLKRLEDARRDGNPILGLLLGDGCGYRAGYPAAATSAAAQRALQSAGLGFDQVETLEPGGGKLSIRADQQRGLSDVYADKPVPRPELTGLIGHLGAAEGIVSVLRATLEPGHGIEGVHGVSESGLACHLLLAPPAAAARRELPREVARVGGATLQELTTRLTRGAFTDELGPRDRHRLVVVARHPAEMPARLELARTQLGGSRSLLEEQGIFLGQVREERPRVAFMFSGQGSQYSGMLQELVQISPAARELLAEADRLLIAAGLPTFAELAWGEGQALDEDPVTTQVAVLVADMLVYAAVRESGLEPDCVGGHSFGEIPAMVAARVITLEQAITLTRERARALLAASPDGGLLSVAASPKVAEKAIQASRLELFLTHQNAPEQSVVGGRLQDLNLLAERLAEQKVKTRLLKVPGALHTPLVRAAQAPMRKVLQEMTLRPPTRLFYSNVTNRLVADPAEFVENLVAQLTDPIRYPVLLERMVEQGVGAFLEIGPNQVLTGLHRQILAGRELVVASTDHPRRGAHEQLARARAALECVGMVASQPTPASSGVAPGDVLEFDATTQRRQRRRAEASATPVNASHVSPEPETMDSGMARLLIDFVVDLTGYPPEVISLDWDLEADLGIDSIKRAQLLGEVAEAMAGESAQGNLQLESFRTLRQILEFMARQAPRSASEPVAPDPRSQPSFRQGFEQGLHQAVSVRQRLRQAAAMGQTRAETRSPAELRALLTPSELAQLQGMAEGAGVHEGNLLAYRLRFGQFPGEGSPGSDQPVTARYLMELIDLPQPVGGLAPRWHGAALVVAHNPVADELIRQLEGQGVTARRASSVAELERLWAEAPLPHLFLTTPYDAEAPEHWTTRRQTALELPFQLCQKWLILVKAAGLMEDASLVATVNLGGDFGFETRPQHFEGGILTGLLKAILIESWVAGFRHLPVKLIDASAAESPEQVVGAALAELALPSYETEVALSQGRRRVVRPVRRPLQTTSRAKLEGTWICTGGARGITAFVATELGRRYGLTLHLIGRIPRSELPEDWQRMWTDQRRELKVRVMNQARSAGQNAVKAWESAQKGLEIEETLARLTEMGIEAHYHSCDVSDREQLGRVLEQIRSQGPIRGILHGAGSSRDAKFEQKEAHRVDQCFRAKVDGTLALMELTSNDPIRYFVGFGSISGRFGANGHADYSSANDALAKLVDWYRGQRPEVAAVTFHWHAWGDVGMATRAETQLGLQAVDMQFMPAAEGLTHLIDELEAGAPESEVLITDDTYYARFYPNELVGAEADGEVRPLLGKGNEVLLDPEKETFLTEHRLDDRPILPLVVALELACESAVQGGPFSVQQVRAVSPLRFHDLQPKKVRVHRQGPEVTVACDLTARDGTLLEADKPILRLQVNGPAHPGQGLTVPVPKGPWSPVAYSERGARLYHGPAFRALRKVCLLGDELWGQITAPAVVELSGTQRPTVGWRVPCAVLDACLYAVGYLSFMRVEPTQTVPAGMAELTLGRLPIPREDCLVHVRFLERSEGGARFDFRLYGNTGELLAEALGYELSLLTVPALVGNSGAVENS